MAQNIARIMVSGRIGRDAETKTIGQSTVTEFSLANQPSRQAEVPTWFRCSIWGKRGSALEHLLKKGAAVTVVGSFSARQYDSKGESKTSLEIRADDLEITKYVESDSPKMPRQQDGIEDQEIPF